MADKLWNVTYRGKKIAVVHNALTPALGDHVPAMMEVRSALPAQLRHMRLEFSSRRNDEGGESVECNIHLYRKSGAYHSTIHALAYDFPRQ